MAVKAINIQPVIIENIFHLSGFGVSQKERYRELEECHKVPSNKSYVMLVKAAFLLRGYVGIY